MDSIFSPAMLHHILKFTNQHAAAHYARKKVQWDPIDMVELKAFFGILYLLGVSKGNHESIRNLWMAQWQDLFPKQPCLSIGLKIFAGF